MTLTKRGFPALILTCAFAMFAVAAIPTDAKASTYYNGQHITYHRAYTQPVVVYYYTYPTYPVYTYTYLQNPTRKNVVKKHKKEQDYFIRDWKQATNDWNAQMKYYSSQTW